MTLRKALGDGASEWIETIPKHGYRFAAEVSLSSPAPWPADASAASAAARVRIAELSRCTPAIRLNAHSAAQSSSKLFLFIVITQFARSLEI
jgi:DNA-binding winged helix-turn-helix (wHTH) protein